MTRLEFDQHDPFDLLIIGGGLVASGIARDAAGRGLTTILCAPDDLGEEEPPVAIEVIEAGLRDLRRFRIRQARDALAERELLLAAAPHLARLAGTALTASGSRGLGWLAKLHLRIYDRLLRTASVPSPVVVNLGDHPAGEPLRGVSRTAVVYPGVLVDAQRLTVLNALDARARGAVIAPRYRCVAARVVEDGVWRATVEDTLTGETGELRARTIVNAAGHLAGATAREVLGIEPRHRPDLVVEQQIIIPRLDPDNDDARTWRFVYHMKGPHHSPMFVVPFERDYSLVSVTRRASSTDVTGASLSDAAHCSISKTINLGFKRQIDPDDVTRVFIGARSASRHHRIERHPGMAPAVTVWGGDATSFRPLAETVVEALRDVFPAIGERWTASEPLPGGKLSPAGPERFERMATSLWNWLPADVALGYAHRYGTRIHSLTGNASSIEQMGAEISPGFYEREARFLVREEWALTAEDLLWRRTRHGLRASGPDVESVERWLAGHVAGASDARKRENENRATRERES